MPKETTSSATKAARGRPSRPVVRVPLAELRERRGVSMQDLCDLSGVSLATISRIEGRLNSPFPYIRRKLASALRVEVDEIAWPTRPEAKATQEQRRQVKQTRATDTPLATATPVAVETPKPKRGRPSLLQ